MVFTILFDDGGKANLVGHPQRMRKEESGEGAGEQGYKYAVRMSLSFFRLQHALSADVHATHPSLPSHTMLGHHTCSTRAHRLERARRAGR